MFRAKVFPGFVENEFAVGHDHTDRFAQVVGGHTEELIFKLVQLAQLRIGLMELSHQVVQFTVQLQYLLTQFLLFLKVEAPQRERSVAQREEPKGFRHPRSGAHGEPMNRALLADERFLGWAEL